MEAAKSLSEECTASDHLDLVLISSGRQSGCEIAT